MTAAEAHQSAVIDALLATNDDDLALRLMRCQQARQHRQPGRYPWRCRSAGCWSCRRTRMRKWWFAFRAWITSDQVSLAVIQINGDPMTATRKLRKGLRDVRDRSARQDHRWQSVAMAGLMDRGRLLILIQHSGIDRSEVWSVLERRYPEVWLYDSADIEPSAVMTVEDAALLARCRRGIAPLRIVILEQAATSTSQDPWDEPMPCIF